MRKIMKRNIQKQRQQRSVTYMRTEQDRRNVPASATWQHTLVSAAVGMFLAWLLLEWMTGKGL